MSRNRNHAGMSYDCASSRGGTARAVVKSDGTTNISLAEARRRALNNLENKERARAEHVEEEARRSYGYKVDE